MPEQAIVIKSPFKLQGSSLSTPLLSALNACLKTNGVSFCAAKTNEVSFQTGILLLKNVILGLDSSILSFNEDGQILEPEYDEMITMPV